MSPAGGGGAGGLKEWMKRICLCFTPSRITLIESARETVSSAVQVFFFCLMQETVRCSRYIILLSFYVERETAHRIKIIYHSCFHNHWPTSKTKLSENLFESKGAPWCFVGPTLLAYSAYREDRLCVLLQIFFLLLL